jgi:hypothetical protein
MGAPLSPCFDTFPEKSSQAIVEQRGIQDMYQLKDPRLPSLTANQFLLITSIHNTTHSSHSIIFILGLNNTMCGVQLLFILDENPTGNRIGG